MRIHLPLHPHHFAPISTLDGSGSSSPLVHLGGELVVIELQGELSYEGDRSDAVVGVLGLDRPDKPTLHIGQHHLLHGKISSLPRPYAVIRRALGTAPGDPGAAVETADDGAKAIEGDAEDEVSDEEREEREAKRARAHGHDSDEDEDDAPLFEPDPGMFVTPSRHGTIRHAHSSHPASSSPPYPPSSAMHDYSSELDFSSPARRDVDEFGFPRGHDDDDDDEDSDGAGGSALQQARRQRRKHSLKKERARHYEVVGVVRKKVVFALRPEPIVTATILPQ